MGVASRVIVDEDMRIVGWPTKDETPEKENCALNCLEDNRGGCKVTATSMVLHRVDAGFGQSMEEAKCNFLSNLEQYVIDVIAASTKIRIEESKQVKVDTLHVADFGR